MSLTSFPNTFFQLSEMLWAGAAWCIALLPSYMLWTSAAGCWVNSASGELWNSPWRTPAPLPAFQEFAQHRRTSISHSLPRDQYDSCSLFSLLFFSLPKEAPLLLQGEYYSWSLSFTSHCSNPWLCSRDTAFHSAFPCALEAVQLAPGRCGCIAADKSVGNPVLLSSWFS